MRTKTHAVTLVIRTVRKIPPPLPLSRSPKTTKHERAYLTSHWSYMSKRASKTASESNFMLYPNHVDFFSLSQFHPPPSSPPARPRPPPPIYLASQCGQRHDDSRVICVENSSVAGHTFLPPLRHCTTRTRKPRKEKEKKHGDDVNDKSKRGTYGINREDEPDVCLSPTNLTPKHGAHVLEMHHYYYYYHTTVYNYVLCLTCGEK